jgi:hypothetical protein
MRHWRLRAGVPPVLEMSNSPSTYTMSAPASCSYLNRNRSSTRPLVLPCDSWVVDDHSLDKFFQLMETNDPLVVRGVACEPALPG